MKKTVKWIIIPLSAIIAVIAIAVALFLFFLSPARLTPVVNKYCTEYLDAQIDFDSVKVSLFAEFPKISVILSGGNIISHAMRSDTAFASEHPANVDTLLRFNEFMVSLNVSDLLRSKINIQRIRISQPKVNAYVSPSGRANWEIYTAAEKTTDDKESAPLDLNIDRFSIRGPADISYNSRPDSMALQASIGRFRLRGNITPDMEKLRIDRVVCSKIKLNADIKNGGMAAALSLDTADVKVADEVMEYHLETIAANYRSGSDTALLASIGSLFARGHIVPDLKKLEVGKLVLSDIKVNADIKDTALQASIGGLSIDGNIVPDLEKLDVNKLILSDIKLNADIKSGGMNAAFSLDTANIDATGEQHNVNLKSAALTYNSAKDTTSLRAAIGGLFLRGNIVTADMEKLDIGRVVLSGVKVNADVGSGKTVAALSLDTAAVDAVERWREYNLKINGIATATVDKENYCSELPLKLNGGLKLDLTNNKFFGFKNFGLMIADLPEIKLNGDITLSEKELVSDLKCKIAAMPIQSVLNLIPIGIPDEVRKIQTDIKFDLNTVAKGSYKFNKKGRLPTIDVDLKIPGGSLVYKGLDSKIDDISIDASLHYNTSSPKKTGLKIKHIGIEAAAAKINGNIDVTNLLDDPDVALNLDGKVDLREAIKFAPDSLGITARGNVSFNAKGSFRASRLGLADLAKNDLIVKLNADKVRVRIPKDTISVLVERTAAELNTTTTRTSRRTGEVSRRLTFDFKSDTARVRLPNREIVAISQIDLSLRSSDAIITGDTSGVIPMGGTVTANTIEYSDVDSNTMSLREVKSNVRIRPSQQNRTLPTIRFDIETKQFRMLSAGNRFGIRDASIALTATENDSATAAQSTRRAMTPKQLDSLQKVYPRIPRDSLQAHARAVRRASRAADDLAGDDIDMRNTELGAMMRKWTVDGEVKSRSGRIVSPYFPLRTRFSNIDIAFTTNDVTMRNITVKCGESQINLTGKIDGIQRALSRGRGLTVGAVLKADTLNINELLTAASNGSAYSESSDEHKKSLADAKDEDQLEEMIQKANDEGGEKGQPSLIVVPSNVSVDVKLDVSNGKYSNINIEKLTGALVSRDRCLQLKDIAVETDVGKIGLTALYATRSKKDVTFGADLEFKNIQVERFIQIIPSIDSLLPMLSSFRGIVNTQLTATSSMDSAMNIIMPSLNAACRISGQNMVLLDGETFSEIAKTLRFKNRKENLVDSISVEVLLRDSKMEIFPFIMQVDRYRLGIGGTHNLDMTFQYHISVLKSPLMIPLGINLSGNLDKIKFGVGKARYKDTNKQAYVTVIDDARLNLRTQIDNFIQQGVDAARFSQFNAPAVASSLIEGDAGTLSAADSLALFKEGIIDTPVSLDVKTEAEAEVKTPTPAPAAEPDDAKTRKRKKRK